MRSSAGTAGSAGSAGRGRRPGGPDTRGEILEAARHSFAARGFRGTTIRGVAADAGVDASLVHHYFGSKDDLFVAALEAPVDPRVAIPAVLAEGIEGAGTRLVALVLEVWDDEDARRPFVALVRSSLSDPGNTLLHDGFVRVVVRSLADALPADDQPLVRAQLFLTQMLGLLMARYVIGVQPLAGTPRAEVVARVGPTLDRYLTGPLP